MNEPIPRAVPVHAPMDQFPVRDGELVVGGERLSLLAARVGATPFYAVDRGLLRRRVAELRAALPAGVKLHYAMKANPMPALVAFMAGLVDGIDVASGGELKVALDAGADAAEVSFAGPGKRDAELRQAVAARVLVNVESERELAVLAAAAAEFGVPARVAVRVNPDFELKGSGMRMGGGAKQFGVDADRVPALLARIGELGLAFEGFHLFAGSQNLRAEAICEAQRQSYELALRLAAHAPAPLRFLNLGGGFGIPYFPGETRLDLAPIGANLQALAERARTELPEASLVIELGRYFVGEAGVYVTRVVDRKLSRGQVFLVCDGGLNHHLAASGNFGQVVRKNYPVTVGNRLGDEARETATAVGPLCTPLDLLADRMSLPPADVGDLVVVFQSGAYGASASPQAFLGHAPVTEVLV
ncbi:pyridoxal-dependent decarboxylase, exosortase A system-associated [Rubrivivax benzoatilyticus]|uniref:Pyridoxal-dependent decarboxylase, exosortase A system-associated n=1 Tax=Rubrivivax benzoatilyticus TaxID=316997 RepID=A0ABX0HWM0_9BURK|nr:pyridoxal-dependent decarboxylase, exosortase A system-associated [Rubrivivax benzoatilyticus]EGJ09386.1 diaminopimelate decarboxylase [Rubrivivax benzoatilyticus JA2 = ATCC BAA-35]NHK99397.1 pyridoxal-dependent decarboxylase, exosortase A system-associated [Rubrivivax benzoatilyticus]NHL25271.1 pyridoxal-dependent decarboxylase, exosortase A system-associated [Rubrivivax benzoatilyticus]